MRFKIDWANLIVGSEFTVFALFFFVFEGNFPSTNPRGGLYLEGRFWRGLQLEGLIFGILRYCPSQEPLLFKSILFSLYIIHFHIFKTLMKKSCFHPAYFRLLNERK